MTHVGIICPPYPGHIHPQAALGRELQARGHRVTMFQISDLECKVRSEGLEFWEIGRSLYQPGTLTQTFQHLAQLSEIKALHYSVEFCRRMAEMICQDAPTAIQAAGVDLLIVDQLECVGESVAEHLGLPFICVSCGQVIHRRADVPPFFTPWRYRDNGWARIRNQIAYGLLDWSCRPILQVINAYRQQWQLSPYPHLYASNARLAHISQEPAEFDFPYPDRPSHLHYVGPLRHPTPYQTEFPFDQLTGQPLIYASLGSVQNTKADLFHTIAAACAGLEAQLVITHGGGMTEEAAQSLPGRPLVVNYAPQQQVIAKARLTITHGGLNTVLDSLSYGVPLVAIPITFEQPGTGARIRWTGTGDVIPISRLDRGNLRQAIQRVMTDASYTHRAMKMQQAIAQAGGVTRAADIVEQALRSNRPVLGAA